MEILSTGVRLRDALGHLEHVSWQGLPMARAIDEGQVAALTEPLRPLWDVLDDKAKGVALRRLEVVQEVITGYRDGHHELAREGEPRSPFGPGFGVSESRRCTAMAELLAYEGEFDRETQRRVRDGELQSAAISVNTVRKWVRDWKQGGLRALIDGRSTRQSKSWDLIDPRYRQVAQRVIDTLDGDKSTVSLNELDRRTRVALRSEGITDVVTPQRITQAFLSTLKRTKGTTTRAQRSSSLQAVSGTRHYPALRPGQVVAIDATRADNLVYDALNGRAYSVEILTAIDVATRVVLALRVVPRSADGIDAGLMIYDVCRPFSLAVDGSAVGPWRWVGLPEQVDMSQVAVRAGSRVLAPDFTTLQGQHEIPSVMPDAIRCDRGAIFISEHFRAVLHDLGVDLLLSRGRKPTDNPHVERWHETLQRAVQQIPGYKGRNTSERGRLVGQEPLLTAQELQQHLRAFIALDYHRSWHTGLVLPGEPSARVSPLEMWDAMVEATGRIDVPQRSDLIYQFLPVRWATIGHAGVELSDIPYDSEVLDRYRRVERGRFRQQDCAAPFFVDPHDLSRIWFRDPETQRVEPIEWRGANR
ncbi:DDE-type integrase/transposase/recombinase, partial [Mycobacteroides abscessus]